MTATLEQGATNCVVQCAHIKAGQEVFLVNQEGAVEPAVVDAIEAAIRGHGARVEVTADEREICRDGQFDFFDEPALASEIARLNVADDVLKSVPLRFN